MSDHVPGYLATLMGLGAGAYTIIGWRKGRIRWRGVSERADGPLLFWSAIVSAGLWSAICTGAGIYMILW
jgi:hypothetical protein